MSLSYCFLANTNKQHIIPQQYKQLKHWCPQVYFHHIQLNTLPSKSNNLDPLDPNTDNLVPVAHRLIHKIKQIKQLITFSTSSL